MPQYLIAQSERPHEREARRDRTGRSAGESYAATLRQMAGDADIDILAPTDADTDLPSLDAVRRYDAVFLTGSPMHVYHDTPEVARQLAFMRAVFASGVPSFGSCAGLQIAVVAAGGRVRKMPQRSEAGVARGISATDAGRDHPLLAGRPPVWDAAAIHGDEVAELPPGGKLLAGNEVTTVQAAEIRHDGGIFWGVQYHPELSLEEIALALRAQADNLVEAGLAEDEGDVAEQTALLDRLHADPGHAPTRWRLGVGDELAVEANRRREIANFLSHLGTLRGAG
ncbi:glutamine amidotransferase [Nostoc sp. 3335mG]|nr:glutamine amidotransferase [Nostoc sp. 3335mG]